MFQQNVYTDTQSATFTRFNIDRKTQDLSTLASLNRQVSALNALSAQAKSAANAILFGGIASDGAIFTVGTIAFAGMEKSVSLYVGAFAFGLGVIGIGATVFAMYQYYCGVAERASEAVQVFNNQAIVLQTQIGVYTALATGTGSGPRSGPYFQQETVTQSTDVPVGPAIPVGVSTISIHLPPASMHFSASIAGPYPVELDTVEVVLSGLSS